MNELTDLDRESIRREVALAQTRLIRQLSRIAAGRSVSRDVDEALILQGLVPIIGPRRLTAEGQALLRQLKGAPDPANDLDNQRDSGVAVYPKHDRSATHERTSPLFDRAVHPRPPRPRR